MSSCHGMSTAGSQAGGQHCPCPQVDQFLEGVHRRSGWQQTRELLEHMNRCPHWLEDVGAKAVADCPSIADQMSEMCCIRPTTTGLFEQLQDSQWWSVLLGLCLAGSVQQGLEAVLLLGSITRSGLGSLTVGILRRGSATLTDSLLMDYINFAVFLQHKTVLLRMLQHCPRSRRLFKQNFVLQKWRRFGKKGYYYYQQYIWKIRGQVDWMYFALYDAGEKDLALFVAANSPHDDLLIEDFCWMEKAHFDVKQKMYRYALRKLYAKPVTNSKILLKALCYGRSRSDCSYIFRQNVRLGMLDALCHLPKMSIFKADLKLFTAWYLLENADYERFFLVCANLENENIEWLERHGIKRAMKTYFRSKSNSGRKSFTEQFPTGSDTPIFSTLFRKAIEKCVQSDCVNIFVELCEKRTKFHTTSMKKLEEEDLKFAYSSALDKRHVILEACERKIFGLSNTLILLDVVVEGKAWDVLPVLHRGLASTAGQCLFQVLRKCVFKMLSDQSIWPGMAPALDQWIREAVEFLLPQAYSVKSVLLEKQWQHSVSSLKRWCVDSGHVYLAFFLALVTADWTLVETAVTSLPSLEIHPETLWSAVNFAAFAESFSACVAMLKAFPVNAEVIDGCRVFPPVSQSDHLAKACEEQGLVDWAVVVQCHDVDYMRDRLHSYHNQAVLDWILKKVVSKPEFPGKWDIARELMTGCTDSEILKLVLEEAIRQGREGIAKALIVRVDPLTCGTKHRTLLSTAVRFCSNAKSKMGMVSLCLASGLSTFQRLVHDAEPRVCCLLADLEFRNVCHLDVLKALLELGTFSYKSLHRIAKDKKRQACLTRDSEDWKQGYREICQAAAAPCRLEHMARLVVSHSLGCQPGRDDRISSLPLPSGLKDKIRFKDILQPETEKQGP